LFCLINNFFYFLLSQLTLNQFSIKVIIMNDFNKENEVIFGKAIPQLIHDIRNPLNIIIGFSSMIQIDSNLSPEVISYLKKISQSGMFIEELLSNIDYYMMEKNSSEESICDLKELTSSFFIQKADIIKDKNIILHQSIDDNIKTRISSNIFIKILENFFQFSVKGFNTSKSRQIQIVICKEKEYILIYYFDTTEPIAIESSYFSTDEVLNVKRGLGLEFNKKFILDYNGDIEYKFAKNWQYVQENLDIKFFANHGFTVKLPVRL
jgi:signal transduction histidine kinase